MKRLLLRYIRPLSRTTWLSRYQKGKTSLHLNKARDYGVLGCSGISWTVCKQCAPNSRQIITPTPHTHPFNGSLSGTTRASRYQKGKPIWILLKQETVSGSGISWAICKSAPCSRQITTPAPHHSVFYRPDALPAAQPTASKHWRHANMATTCEYQSKKSTYISGKINPISKSYWNLFTSLYWLNLI